jgi:hypothetical protein
MMMETLLAGIVGGVIGGAVVGIALYLRAPWEWLTRAAARRESGRVTSLSYRLWRLYVALVSGSAVPRDRLRDLYDEVLLLTAGCDREKETEEALFAMTFLLQRAWKRAAEFRRVQLKVSPGQFADLTESMQAAFAAVQLASGRLCSLGREPAAHVVDIGAARLGRLVQPRS